MLRTVFFALLLAASSVSGAQASCLSRALGSNCFEPRGNSAMSRPGQRQLIMPQADPRVVPRVAPERRAAPGMLRRSTLGPFPTVNGRVLRHPSLTPCEGALCGRQQRYFPEACRSSRCL